MKYYLQFDITKDIIIQVYWPRINFKNGNLGIFLKTCITLRFGEKYAYVTSNSGFEAGVQIIGFGIGIGYKSIANNKQW